MNIAAVVALPSIVTDWDYGFDWVFFDGDEDTPHDFPSDDVAHLVIVPKGTANPKIVFQSSDGAARLTYPAENQISLRIPKSVVAAYATGSYAWALRRLAADGSIDPLAVGVVNIEAGLSLSSTSSSFGIKLGEYAASNVIFEGAQTKVVYPSVALHGSLMFRRGPQPEPDPAGAIPWLDETVSPNIAKLIFPGGNIADIAYDV